MQKPWIVIAATVAISSAVTGAWAYTSGPSISLGSNPLRTLTATATWQNSSTSVQIAPQAQGPAFEVPQGQTLVLTDLSVSASPVNPSATNAGNGDFACSNLRVCVMVDNVALYCSLSSDQEFKTGLAIASGSKVHLYLTGYVPYVTSGAGVSVYKCVPAAVATGYLMKN